MILNMHETTELVSEPTATSHCKFSISALSDDKIMNSHALSIIFDSKHAIQSIQHNFFFFFAMNMNIQTIQIPHQ